jgi:hypothetical protein
MLRLTAIALVLTLAAPAFAQTPAPWANQVDPRAIYEFDPDGAAGIPLTADLIRAYLAAPIKAPTAEQRAALDERRRAAKAAKAAILSDDNIFAPRWTENEFELQDGSIRPMTIREKAVFAELDAVAAGEASLRSQLYLSMANDTERAVLANALVRLLEAGVRLSHDQSDGYVTDSNSEWLWIDFQDGQVVASHPPTIEVENALLRYDVARRTLASGISTRMHTSPPDLRPIH